MEKNLPESYYMEEGEIYQICIKEYQVCIISVLKCFIGGKGEYKSSRIQFGIWFSIPAEPETSSG